jgi:hypothetical protein
MKLTKQTKTLIGLGVLGIGAYLIWKQNKDKQNFGGFNKVGSRNTLGRPRTKNPIFSMPTGETLPTNPFDKSSGEATTFLTASRNPCGCGGLNRKGTVVSIEDGTAICSRDDGNGVFGCKFGNYLSYYQLIDAGVLR